MKQLLHKLFGLTAALALSSTAWAAVTVTAHGINYELSSNKATIIKSPSATGYIRIPSAITVDGKTYAVTAIGEEAFKGCTGITTVDFANGCTAIRTGAFSGCTGLTKVILSTSVTSISNSVFAGCTSLSSVTMFNGLTSLGNYVFSNCTSLTSLTIPSTLKSMGDNSITSCTALTNITVAEGNTHFALSDGGLYELTDGALTKLVFCLPSTEGDFVIADGVTEIAPSAFSATTKVTSVFVPESVTEIGESAFKGEGITKITVESATPAKLGKYAIDSKKTAIRVPYDAIETYKSKWGTSYNYVMLPIFTGAEHVSIESYTYNETDATAAVVVTFSEGYVFGGVSVSGDDEAAVSATCADGVVSITSVTGVTYVISATDVASLADYWSADNGTTEETFSGSTATVTVIPNDGYVFDYVTKNDVLLDGVTPDSDGNVTLTDVMETDKYVFYFTDIAALADYRSGDHGTIEATFSGSTSTVAVAPDDGYALGKVTKNGETLDATPVNGKVTLTSVSATDEYIFYFTDIAALADYRSGDHGSIEATFAGGTATVTVTPADGYVFDHATLNGETLDGLTPDSNGKIVIEVVVEGDEYVFHFKKAAATRIAIPIAADGDCAVYDLLGRRISASATGLPSGVYVVVSGGKARKVVVR